MGQPKWKWRHKTVEARLRAGRKQMFLDRAPHGRQLYPHSIHAIHSWARQFHSCRDDTEYVLSRAENANIENEQDSTFETYGFGN